MFETTLQDLRHSLRALRRAPAFTVAALLTLALGIGATTAIFSVVNAALLEPPPYAEPDRLFALTTPDGSAQTGQIFHYIRDRVRAFERVAAQRGGTGWNLVAGRHAEYVTGGRISRDYFDVLGVRPLIGRAFTDVEDQPKGPRAVIFSEPLWRRVLDGRPDAVGGVIQLGGIPHTVVGVMPATFRSIPAVDLWTPLQLSARDNSWNYSILARLRPRITETEAARELDAIRPALARDIPDVPGPRVQLMQWMPYQRWLGLAVRGQLLLLLGAVAFLLLIACVNVASLQLVRASARRGEIATRAALGSGRARLTRQVLVESVLLALGGALLGLVVAQWGTRGLLAFVPEGLLAGRVVAVDGRVLGVTLAVSVAAGILFGLAPAFGATRVDIREALWHGGRQTAGRSTMWLRRSFIVVEVALAVVLLVGAGLLMRTFVNLRSVEPGFDPEQIVIGKMSLQGAPLPDAGAFFERTLGRLRTHPGVTAAAVGNSIPVERGLNLAIEPPPGALVDGRRAVDWRYVTSDYFAVFHIPLRAGRTFADRDRPGGTPVAIVNEAFARAYFGGANPLGQTVRLAMSSIEPPRQIVGVVGDVKSRSGSGWTRGPNALGTPAPPALYVPVAQLRDAVLNDVHQVFPINWAIRTRGASATIGPAIQQIVESAAPQMPFIRFATMEELVARDIERERFLMTLLAVFAVAAMALAATGMYGLTAYTAAQRTKEVGIRIAIGATGGRVLLAFLREGLSLALAGVVIGLGASVLLARLLASFIFGISPHDPLTFAGVTAVLLVVSGLAALLPSLHAARTDPVRALRLE